MHLLSQDCLVFAAFPNYLEFPRDIFHIRGYLRTWLYPHIVWNIICDFSTIMTLQETIFRSNLKFWRWWNLCVYNSWSKYAQCKSDPNMVPLPWLSSDLWQSCRLWRKAHINPKPYQARHKSPAAPWRTRPKYKRLEQMTWCKIGIWDSCRCSRKQSMVEGRFSKWF